MSRDRKDLIEEIASNWLQGYSELNGESRIYLMRNVLPTVIPAIEELMKKLDRSQFHVTDPSAKKFDPKVWLAQQLFRINPQSDEQDVTFDSVWAVQANRAEEKLQCYRDQVEAQKKQQQQLYEMEVLNRKRREAEAEALLKKQAESRIIEQPAPTVQSDDVLKHDTIDDDSHLQVVPEPVVVETVPSPAPEVRNDLRSSMSLSMLNLSEIQPDNLEEAIRRALESAFSSNVSKTENSGLDWSELAGSIFDIMAKQKSTGAAGVSSRKVNDLIDLAIKHIDFLDNSQQLKTFLQLLKLPIQARSMLTRRIGREEWLQHVHNSTRTPSTSDYLIYQALQTLNVCAFHATSKLASPVQFRIPSALVVSEILKHSADPRLSVAGFCQEAIAAISRSIQDRHPVFSVYISMLEMENNQKRLRFIACSPKDEAVVLGKSLSEKEAPVSFGSIRLNKTKVVENVREYPAKLNVFGDSRREKDGEDPRLYNGTFATIPLVGPDGQILGMLGFDNIMMVGPQQKIKLFDDVDIKHMEEISKSLGHGIGVCQSHANLIRLAVSSCRWIKQTLGRDTSLILATEKKSGEQLFWDASPLIDAESEASTDQSTTLPEGEEDNGDADERDDESSVADTTEADEIDINEINLQRLVPEKPERSVEIQKQFITPTDQENNRVILFDKQNRPFAVISIKPNESEQKSKSSSAALEEDWKSFSNVLQRARDSFMSKSEFHSDINLDMLFPLTMFDAVKEKLSEIDNKALAELKSYKTPPKTIHLVLKCVLYLFGNKPAAVKQWQDAVKLLNLDLIKAMKNYDPMKVQKKLYFKRIKRVVKKLPTVDSIRQFGSKPAENMFQWLHLSIILRQYGVALRKREKEKAAELAGLTAVQEEVENEVNTAAAATFRPMTAMPNSKPAVEPRDETAFPAPVLQ